MPDFKITVVEVLPEHERELSDGDPSPEVRGIQAIVNAQDDRAALDAWPDAWETRYGPRSLPIETIIRVTEIEDQAV